MGTRSGPGLPGYRFRRSGSSATSSRDVDRQGCGACSRKRSGRKRLPRARSFTSPTAGSEPGNANGAGNLGCRPELRALTTYLPTSSGEPAASGGRDRRPRAGGPGRACAISRRPNRDRVGGGRRLSAVGEYESVTARDSHRRDRGVRREGGSTGPSRSPRTPPTSIGSTSTSTTRSRRLCAEG